MRTSTEIKHFDASWFSRNLKTTGILFGVIFMLSIFTLTPYMVVATISYFCLLMGLAFKKRKKVHAALMGTGIFIDLAIVLILEVTRHAVNTALDFSLSPLQQLHIATSTIATVLYFPVVALGVFRFLGKGDSDRSRRLHMKLGISAFVFRTLGFLLMFSLLWKKQ